MNMCRFGRKTQSAVNWNCWDQALAKGVYTYTTRLFLFLFSFFFCLNISACFYWWLYHIKCRKGSKMIYNGFNVYITENTDRGVSTLYMTCIPSIFRILQNSSYTVYHMYLLFISHINSFFIYFIFVYEFSNWCY